MSRLRLWLRSLLRPGSVERELGDEVRLHLEMETEKNLRAGMSPAQARRKALVDFGGEERFKEQTRETRPTRPLEDLVLDLRYGMRQLRRNPGFTVVALLSLGLGIGANTAIFSVVNAVLLRPLPFARPHELVMVEEHNSGDREPTFSPRDFLDLKEQASALSVVVGWRKASLALTGDGAPERVEGASVTPDFFLAFGVEPKLGRFFTDAPEEDPAGKAVVLSHAAWERRYGGDPSVLGRSLMLDGESHTVVGVAPAGFSFPDQREIWVRSYRAGVPEPPIDIGEEIGDVRSLGYFSALGRLRPGLTLAAAASDLDVVAGRIAEFKDPTADYRLVLVPLREALVGDVRPALLVLLGAVGLVLLIACANVANLLLARAATRAQELAVRSSLGASRRRLVRQLLVESLLLGMGAGVLGLGLARFGFGALLALLPAGIPLLEGIRLDPLVLAFTLGASLATGLLFGLLPTLHASRTDLAAVMRSGARGVVGGGTGSATREAMVVVEVALSVVLLFGAGLLLKSLVLLQDEEVGFDPEGVLVMRATLPSSRYADEPSMAAFVRAVLREVEAIPGATSSGVALAAPFAGGAATLGYLLDGMPEEGGEDLSTEYQVVTPGYLGTMGIPVLRGRGIQEADGDGEGPPTVVLVNEAFARRHWGEENALGQRITVASETPMEIVGVVGNVRHFSFDRSPRPEVYVPYYREPWPFITLVVKTRGDPRTLADPVRRAVLAVDPDQPVHGVRTMEEAMAASVGDRRFTVDLLGIFAAVAVLLALVGVYGVMAYAVSLRAREVGIRVALGAPGGEILWMSFRKGIRLTVLGVGAGMGGALLLSRLLEALLYGVTAWDPAVFAQVALVLTAAVLAAAWVPARRAARADPATVLRAE